MSRMSDESGHVEWAEMHPDNFTRPQDGPYVVGAFRDKVRARNGDLPPHLDETCRLSVRCANHPSCRNYAATNDVGNTGPIYCDECMEQHDYLKAWSRLHPRTFDLGRVAWGATWCVVAVVAVMVALALVVS